MNGNRSTGGIRIERFNIRMKGISPDRANALKSGLREALTTRLVQVPIGPENSGTGAIRRGDAGLLRVPENASGSVMGNEIARRLSGWITDHAGIAKKTEDYHRE